jgi:DNA-binding SARP family transcriptional activator
MTVVDLPIRQQLTSGCETQSTQEPVAWFLPRPRVLLLGSLMVVDDKGLDLEVPSARLVRAVLETLALRAGSVVLAWELIDTVWGEDAPVTVRKCLQTYISVLRRLLGSTTIQTIGGGYRLRADPDYVDIDHFERHIRDGSDRLTQGDCSRAVELFSAALDLWRGEPLEELVDSPAGMAARARLWEQYRVAEERLFETRLDLGEHDLLIGDLEAAVQVEPFREHRWEQLMLALYRSGRQNDALAAFDRMTNLLDRNRLSPSEEIQALKTAVTVRHPSLARRVDFSRGWCHRFGAVGS